MHARLRCSSLLSGYDSVVDGLDHSKHMQRDGHYSAQRITTSRKHAARRTTWHTEPCHCAAALLSGRGSAGRLRPKRMKDNGSVAKITPPWTHGKIRRPLRGVESAVLSLSAPSSSLALLQERRCYPRANLKDRHPNRYHSQLGELVRRFGTVPAMSAWKTAAGPPGPGQGSRLRRDRQGRLPGLDRVSAGRVFWLPRAYGCFRARRSTEHEAKYTGRSAFGWRPEAILVDPSRCG